MPKPCYCLQNALLNIDILFFFNFLNRSSFQANLLLGSTGRGEAPTLSEMVATLDVESLGEEEEMVLIDVSELGEHQSSHPTYATRRLVSNNY